MRIGEQGRTRMRYTVQSVGGVLLPLPQSVSLDKQDFKAQGGQAKVFVQGNFAYKVYHKPEYCIPVKKIEELSQLARDRIIRPIGLLIDKGPVGLVMQKVEHAVPLARLVSDTFRTLHKIDSAMIVDLIRRLRDDIAFIHQRKCLVIDANEMNFLVDERTFVDPICIDVDSYQTPHFPATAIANSVRDFRATKFDEGTDWFSFGIVACHIMIGLHPFRGNHPKCPSGSLEERIKTRTSIFDRGVKIPPATRDFSVIPDDYRQWFVEIFGQGKSVAAPENAKSVVILLASQRKQIVRLWEVTVKSGRVLKVSDQDGVLLVDGSPSTVKAQKIFVVENCLYALNNGNFAQVKLNEFGTKVIASLGTIWHVLPHATTVLEGLLYQDVMGQPYIVVPLKPGICHTVAVPQMLGYKVVDGKYQAGVAELIFMKNGQYDRLQLKLKENGQYTSTLEQDINYQ